MNRIFIVPINSKLSSVISQMDKMMNEFTTKAAQGKCEWICADCSCSFPEGMPDACIHNDQRCTDIIVRDKQEARGK